MSLDRNTDDAASKFLSVVVPAFDEAGGIGRVIDALRAAFPDSEIVVVDDGSTDGTGAIAASRGGVRVLAHDFNRGYGASLRTGMAATSRPLIAWFDSDGEHRVEDLRAMVARLQRDKLAAVIGSRGAGGPAVRRTGKWMIRLLARVFGFGAETDLNCGLRVFRRDVVMPYLSLLPNRFSASLTTTLTLIERGYPIAFHPIVIEPRVGTSKVALGDGFAAIALVLRMLMLFAPLRLFLPSGAALVVLGTIYGLAISVIDGTGFPVAGLLAILVGLNIGMLGLIADQISQMRLARIESLKDDRGRAD